MKRCANCGTENGGTARFCATCGTRLPSEDLGVSPSRSQRQTGPAGAGGGRPRSRVVAAALFLVVAAAAAGGLFLVKGRLRGAYERLGLRGQPAAAQESPALSQAESDAWQDASQADAPAAYAEFFRSFPGSPLISVRKGTLRGRYWCRIDGALRQDGVLVTVEGTDYLVSVPVGEAVCQGLIYSRLAAAGLEKKSRGQSFRFCFAEIVEGGYIVARRIRGEVVKEVVEPKDSENCTLIVSANGERLLSWDLSSATCRTQADTRPTFVAGGAGAPPFDADPPASGGGVAESQELSVCSSAGE